MSPIKITWVIIITWASFINDSFAQGMKDLDLIFSSSTPSTLTNQIDKKRKRIIPYLFKPGFIFYKKVVYPQLGLTCFFHHQCIDFCGDLIERYGLAKGYFISLNRVARCNRLLPLETYPAGLSDDGRVIDSLADY